MDQLSLFDPTHTPSGRAVNEAADGLPRLAIELVEVMGMPAAMQLIHEFGGRRIIVPGWPLKRRSSRFQFLEDMVGAQAAQAFAQRWGNIEVQVPMCKKALQIVRVREVVAAYGRGEKVPELARVHQVTESTVWKWLKRDVSSA